MPQFSMLVDEVFGHEAKILNIKEIGVRSNIYSSALGMTKYYDEIMNVTSNYFITYN